MQINEIYQSIEGEMSAHHQGAITTFIRFQGCNLTCSYCDSKFTWKKDIGFQYTLKEVMNQVYGYGNKNITITGGEPLMQRKAFIRLVERLHREGYEVVTETNGTYLLPFHGFNNKTNWVVDWKLDINPFQKDTLCRTIKYHLSDTDVVKFIIGNMDDFYNAIDEKIEMEKVCIYPPKFALSAMFGRIKPATLVEWMFQLDKAEKRNLYLNTQLHKFIWKSNERRV